MKTTRRKKTAREVSVLEALNDAEREHWLDSSVADPWLRLAAFVLDGILVFVGVSGLENVANAFGIYLAQVPIESAPGWLFPLVRQPQFFAASLGLFLRLSFLYFYFVWALTVSGGTPAKLLFGLRVIDERSGFYLSIPQAFIRIFIQLILAPSMALAWFRRDRRPLHDLLVGSSVRRVEEDP